MYTKTRPIKSRQQLKRDIWGWAMVSPLVVGLLLFSAYPVLYSLIQSFFNVDLVTPMNTFGLHNYQSIFVGDYSPRFFKALKNTLVYVAVQVPLGMVLAYSLANLIHKKFKGNKLFLILFYLPALVPDVVSGLLWQDILNERYGIINTLLTNVFDLPGINFMDESRLMPTYIWMQTFGIGGGLVVWLAALDSVDKTLYEAANIDGANILQKFFRITLPMTSPYIFYNLIMGIIGSMQIFSGPYILTGGTAGDGDALLVINMIIYETAFTQLKFGLASAMAWVLCVIVIGFTLIAFKTNKWVVYSDD